MHCTDAIRIFCLCGAGVPPALLRNPWNRAGETPAPQGRPCAVVRPVRQPGLGRKIRNPKSEMNGRAVSPALLNRASRHPTLLRHPKGLDEPLPSDVSSRPRTEGSSGGIYDPGLYRTAVLPTDPSTRSRCSLPRDDSRGWAKIRNPKFEMNGRAGGRSSLRSVLPAPSTRTAKAPHAPLELQGTRRAVPSLHRNSLPSPGLDL